MKNKEQLFLIDAMALAYRSYFAFIRNPLKNSKGENTSALFGFVTFLNRILTQEQPAQIAVVFDTGKPTFRHKIYKEYKATRQNIPEDMISQIPWLKEIIKAYNIPQIELEGFEADDIIGTLAKQAETNHINCFLVTPDKDFMQLVSEKIKIYKPSNKSNDREIIDIEWVKEKFGVPPDNVIDALALIGDASDNIPGVPGVGEKTAVPLIQKYKTLENLYNHIDEIESKSLKTKLENNKELAFLSKKLLTIDTQVPLSLDYASLRTKSPDNEKLKELFNRFEFRSFLNKIQLNTDNSEVHTNQDSQLDLAHSTIDVRSDSHQYHTILTKEDFLLLCRKLKDSSEFVLDTETTSTNALIAELVGISFALKTHEAYYVPVKTRKEQEVQDFFQQNTNKADTIGLDINLIVKELKPILESHHIRKIGHNIKYDMLVLSKYNLRVEGELYDTMIAHYILEPEEQHNLDSIAYKYLNYKTVSYTDLTGKGKDQKNIKDIPIDKISEYSCEDSDITFRLYEVLLKKLEEHGLSNLCKKVEFPLISVLYRMEKTGVAIDTTYLSSMSKDLEKQIDNLSHKIQQVAEKKFNLNSTQQLADILFNKLKLKTVRKTKTGYSTDTGVLETLRGEHPIIELILEYRQLNKLKSTYIDALPKLINSTTNRVHTSFNQTVTVTGRLSSSDPNLQNIPIRTDIGRQIRKAFIAGGKNSVILSADYSQIELRVMAHMSRDEGLIEAFKNGEDIHTTTAVKIFGVKPDEVTREMRRKSKEVNFGIMYGIGPYGLSSRLEIKQTEAKEIIDLYFKRFPKVQQYINDTISTARETGYVCTLLGRRRYFPDIRSHNQNIRQNAERQAINMPIQGTAADMIKVAMVNIDSEILKQKLSSSMILQVHDELVFEVKEDELQKVKEIVDFEMRSALQLCVPIEVEIGIGKNWLEAH